MNGNRVLVGEYLISIGFVSWFAIKNNFLPWPPTIVRLSASFGILGILAMAAPEIAAAFGGGVLLAAFLKVYDSGLAGYRGGVPGGTTPGLAGQLGGSVSTFTPIKINPAK